MVEEVRAFFNQNIARNWPIIVFILTQAAFGLIWLVKLDSSNDELTRRVTRIELWNAEQDKLLRNIDIINERQQQVLKLIEQNAKRLDDILTSNRRPNKDLDK